MVYSMRQTIKILIVQMAGQEKILQNPNNNLKLRKKKIKNITSIKNVLMLPL